MTAENLLHPKWSLLVGGQCLLPLVLFKYASPNRHVVCVASYWLNQLYNCIQYSTPQSRGNVKTFSCLSDSAQWLPTRVDYLRISLAAKVSNRRESFHTLDYLARRTVKAVQGQRNQLPHLAPLWKRKTYSQSSPTDRICPLQSTYYRERVTDVRNTYIEHPPCFATSTN